MKPIKVCIVSLYAHHFFYPAVSSKFGGAELQLYLLANELVKDDRFKVFFGIADFGQKDEEIIDGVNLFKIIRPGKYSQLVTVFFLPIKLFSMLFKISADIYIQRSSGIETGIVGLYCRLFRKKFIYMSANDEDFEKTPPSYLKDDFLNRARWFLFKFGLRRADLFLVQNEFQKQNAIKNYDRKIVIRNSAFPTNVVSPNMTNKFDILWVGKADRLTKQPEMFLELAKKFANEKFVMICPKAGDVDFFNELAKVASKIHNLEFIEYVPFQKVQKYFNKAKIFINTSKTEGFPNTFIQAATAGTPILSLGVDPNDILVNHQIGDHAHGNLNLLVAKLKNFLSDKKMLKQYSNKAFAYAKESHDIKKVIEKDKQIILDLVKPGREPTLKH
jgi:glycosyltransferase involved in cell wall biosynthesis